MTLPLILLNFIWPALSFILIMAGITTALIIGATNSDKIHDQSMNGATIRFTMVTFPIIGVLSIILNSFFIRFNQPSIYDYGEQIITGFASTILLILVLMLLSMVVPTVLLWIR